MNDIALYHTRVEEVWKEHSSASWHVRTTTLCQNDGSGRIDERYWQFDAVVVASGHYNMPRIPDIPGFTELKARCPDRIMHSKGYRSPSKFQDKRILIVGAGASSLDIITEAQPVAKQVYRSSRGGAMDAPARMLPSNCMCIGGIKAFHFEDRGQGSSVAGDAPLPGYFELNNGSKLRDIDHVVMGTGYMTSYPFLRQFHADDTRPQDAGDDVLVTADGSMVHNLHKDIFYRADPSLAFIGVPYHVSTFSFFEFQVQAVARVFAGKAKLPAEVEMKRQYKERLAGDGPGRDFHSLRDEGQELAYVADLVAWMNDGAFESGAAAMKGHTEKFLQANGEIREILEKLGLNLKKGAVGESCDHVRP